MRKRTRIFLVFLLCLMGCFFFSGKGGKVNAAMRMNRKELTLTRGKTARLWIKGKKGKKVSWKTSNKAVVTVEQDGTVRAIKGGKATVTAQAGKVKFRCRVTVVGLNIQKMTLAKGNTFKIKVVNGKNTRWYSLNKKVASVSKKGVVKAKKSGETVIVCKSNGRKLKCRIYVASLGREVVKMKSSSTYRLKVNHYGNQCSWSTTKSSVAKVNQQGDIQAVSAGKAEVVCKSGKAKLFCEVTVINPDNIVTKMSQLPQSTNADRYQVTVNGYPNTKSYVIYRQSAQKNASQTFEEYMAYHGCAACAISTVLSGFTQGTPTPQKTVEIREKQIFGTAIWKKNYDKELSKQMPASLYGLTRILQHYGIKNEYVRSFQDSAAQQQITRHLKTGNPVIIEVSSKNRKTGVTDKKWSNSYHTLVLLGMTDTGKAIVADSANRSSFGNRQRIKYESVSNLIPYMFSSTNQSSVSCYFSGKNNSGGYILVNP